MNRMRSGVARGRTREVDELRSSSRCDGMEGVIKTSVGKKVKFA